MPVQLRIDGRKVWRKSKRLLLMKRARDAECKFLEEPQTEQDGGTIYGDGGSSVTGGSYRTPTRQQRQQQDGGGSQRR